MPVHMSYASPNLNRTLGFLSASEADHILSLLPHRDSALWSSCLQADIMEDDPNIRCFQLPLSADPVLPVAVQRLKTHHEEVLQRPVDVSRVDSLPVKLVKAGCAAEPPHADVGPNLQLSGFPAPELTTMITLTDTGNDVRAESAGSTRLLDGDQAVSLIPRKGALSSWAAVTPHHRGALDPDTGDRIAIGLHGHVLDDEVDPEDGAARRRLTNTKAQLAQAVAHGDDDARHRHLRELANTIFDPESVRKRRLQGFGKRPGTLAFTGHQVGG